MDQSRTPTLRSASSQPSSPLARSVVIGDGSTPRQHSEAGTPARWDVSSRGSPPSGSRATAPTNPLAGTSDLGSFADPRSVEGSDGASTPNASAMTLGRHRTSSSTTARLPHAQIPPAAAPFPTPSPRHAFPYSLVHDIALHASRFFSTPLSADARYRQSLNVALCQLVKQVTPSHLNLTPLKEKLEYYPIYESDVFTMCVFVMSKGAGMPAHDHPGMSVFSKVVAGTLHVRSYEMLSHPAAQRVPNPSYTPGATAASSSTQPPLSHHGHQHPTAPSPLLLARPALITLDADIPASDPRSLLTISPESGTNLHTFTAASDQVIILDIIGPPYNGTTRRCTYFRELGSRERRALGLPKSEKWGDRDGTGGKKDRKKKSRHGHGSTASPARGSGSGSGSSAATAAAFPGMQANMDWEVFDFSTTSLGSADGDMDKWALYDKSTGSIGVYDRSTGGLTGIYDSSTGAMQSLAAALGGLSVAPTTPELPQDARASPAVADATPARTSDDTGKRLWLVEDPAVDYDCAEREYNGEMVYLTGAGAPQGHGVPAGVLLHPHDMAEPTDAPVAPIPVVAVKLPADGTALPSTRKRREAAHALGNVAMQGFGPPPRHVPSSTRTALQQAAVQQRLENELRQLGYDFNEHSGPIRQRENPYRGAQGADGFGAGISVEGLASLMGTSAMELDWDAFDVSTRSLPGM